MGAISQADIPGNFLTFSLACASVASQTATTRPMFVAPAAGTIVAAYTVSTTAWAAGTSTTQGHKIVNRGAAGAGTTVLASQGVASAVVASVPRAWSAVADNSFAAGDALTWVHVTSASGAGGLDVLDYLLVVKYRLT